MISFCISEGGLRRKGAGLLADWPQNRAMFEKSVKKHGIVL
jgi:hypothetical protein